MSDGIMLSIGDDGIAREYDDTYDITIHCESEEEQEEVKRALKSIPHWIPVTERLPKKDGRYYVTLENKYVKILYYAIEQTLRHPKGFYYLTEDGRMAWSQTQNPVVAWMPLPEPYKGVTE